MSATRFTDEFKRDAVAQVEDRGYPVREVAERLGVSTKSICKWQKLFSRPAKVVKEVDAQTDEVRRLKRDLLRVTEEQDILKRTTGGSTGQRNGFYAWLRAPPFPTRVGRSASNQAPQDSLGGKW